ncbi:MAG: selenium metabolism-associated LysR family transcriptional regulator [Anaerolineae bacterium]|jgi:DNA-binding transcriptional LysR family regulator
MNLEYLHTLISVVEHGSLSAAARAKRISQPAVTKQIQRLEAEIGVTLLVRGPRRRAELTPAGEHVLAFARETLARYQALEEELAVLKEIGSGTLVVAASTIPGEYLLPALLAAFRREYPHIQVEMMVSDTDGVADRLLDRRADVGMVGSPVDRPDLRLERLVRDEIVLVIPSRHDFAGRRRVTADDLRGQSLILREEGSGTRHSVEAALATAGLSLPRENVVLTLGSTQAVLQAVEQGLGVGFVSARAAGPAQSAGRVAWTRLDGVDLGRDLYLAYLPGRMGDPLVARFLAFARQGQR